MSVLLVFQLALPLGLIGWLGLRPLRSTAGLAVQVTAISLVLLAVTWAGVWIIPPWWSPRAYGVLALVALAWGVHHRPPSPTWPSSWREMGALVVLLALGAGAAWQAAGAWIGRRLPSGSVVELMFPLGPGRYLVVQGGNHICVNAHLKTRDSTIARYRPWVGNSHAVDLIGISPMGWRASGLQPSNPSRYQIYGAPVLAPCTGTVVATANSAPDQQVPHMDTTDRVGNHVLLRCGDVDVLLAHFEPGSVSVRTGEVVQAGQQLGRVGNSGASGEPHLHVHAQRPGTPAEPFSGLPLHMTLDGRFLVRGDRIQVGP